MINGDIVLIRNSHFLARAIHFFMTIWYRVIGKMNKGIYNHADIYIDGYSVGSRKHGIGELVAKSYYDKNNKYLVLTPVKPYNKAELERGRTYIDSVLGNRYEYFNFISWIVYIFSFGLIKLSKKTDKRAECFEFVARFSNACRKGMFNNDVEYTSENDILSNTNFKIDDIHY